jgi:hypothetical protein
MVWFLFLVPVLAGVLRSNQGESAVPPIGRASLTLGPALWCYELRFNQWVLYARCGIAASANIGDSIPKG